LQTAGGCYANQHVVVPSLQRGDFLGRRASEDYDI